MDTLYRVLQLDNDLTALLISDTLIRQKRNNQTTLEEEKDSTAYKKNSNEVESDSDDKTISEDNESDVDDSGTDDDDVDDNDNYDNDDDDNYDDDDYDDNNDDENYDDHHHPHIDSNSDGEKRANKKDRISSTKRETKLVSTLKVFGGKVMRTGYFSNNILSERPIDISLGSSCTLCWCWKFQ